MPINLDEILDKLPHAFFLGEPIVEENDLELLLYLLENIDATRYRISKETGLQQSTVWQTAKVLEKKGLIEVTEVRKHGKQIIPHFQLTKKALWGLFAPNLEPRWMKFGPRYFNLSDFFSKVKNNYPEFLPKDLREIPIDFLVLFYQPFIKALSKSEKDIESILYRSALIDIFFKYRIKSYLGQLQWNNIKIWEALTGGIKKTTKYDPDTVERLRSLGYIQ